MTEQFVLPGDQIDVSTVVTGAAVTLGPNVALSKSNLEQTALSPTTAGLLNVKNAESRSPVYYVESNGRRYNPQVNDYVIGIIVGAFGEYYRVSLNSFSAPVLLNQFSFPNASKKNRPRLQTGDLIYARVESVQRNMEAELSCIDPTTGKDGGFGLLTGGFVFDVKLAFARYLLFDADAKILSELVKKCKFEIAIGVNGRIWIKTDDIKTTVACSNAIRNCQTWKKEELSAKVEDTFSVLESHD
ncbi:DEKNAAC101709 [Brettanomyces naardenensis]|uniref:DEKNAAC101709 n=1 Tax=Brettanomyces naardenensis TaxID=13370 RepID=A0A448YIX3_BRENA|nr:DEKNAAC101709 [Brettanomyces naardenensis]